MSDSSSNSNNEAMSRRDWFRLRKAPIQPSPKQAAKRPQPNKPLKTESMQSVEEPVNHGGVDLSTLPPMHEALLDRKEVTALFSDLEQHAGAVQLIARGAAGKSSDQSAQLSLACDQLLSGNVRKLQIRYQWQNAKWIDTLEQRPDGYRLVRIQHVS